MTESKNRTKCVTIVSFNFDPVAPAELNQMSAFQQETTHHLGFSLAYSDESKEKQTHTTEHCITHRRASPLSDSPWSSPRANSRTGCTKTWPRSGASPYISPNGIRFPRHLPALLHTNRRSPPLRCWHWKRSPSPGLFSSKYHRELAWKTRNRRDTDVWEFVRDGSVAIKRDITDNKFKKMGNRADSRTLMIEGCKATQQPHKHANKTMPQTISATNHLLVYQSSPWKY